MAEVTRIGKVDNRHSPYGNIQRIGLTPNGRRVYRVIDSMGEEAGHLSVPVKDTDAFETAYRDIIVSAPKIQMYAEKHSTQEDIKKRRKLARFVVGAGGVTGAAISIVATQNSSALKKVLATVAGIIIGLSVGFVAFIVTTMPSGTYKFAKANRTFARLDIQPEK